MPDVQIPAIFNQLFVPKTINGVPVRYRCAHGGRGGAKSRTFAVIAILKSIESKIRILCTREIQKSLAESVHKLLCDQIQILNLQSFFKITDNRITSSTGSEFLFEGLSRNITKIKSLESIDICWCAEAATLSEESLQVLMPTIRNEDKTTQTYSEIWFEWNDSYEDIPVHQRFVVNKPDNCITIKVGWQDNPFFPDVLKKEMEDDYHYRPLEAKNIWGGEPIGTGGKIYTDFKREIHVKEFDMKDIKRTANFLHGCDPASHYYWANIFIALIPISDGRYIKWVYNEWPDFNTFGQYFSEIRNKIHDTMSVADRAKQFFIADGTSEHGLKISKRYLDTRYAKGTGAENTWTPMSLVQECAKPENGGILFELPSEKIIDVQREVIKKDMQYNTLAEVNQYNQPSFYVSPRCKNLIQTLTNHRLEEDSEKESAKFKDFSDALRICYAGLATYRWVDPNPNKRAMSQYNSNYTGADGWMS